MSTASNSQNAPTAAIDRIRRRVYEVIEMGSGEDRTSKAFDTFIVTLILLNVAAFAAETVPSLEHAYGKEFFAFEAFSVAIFTIEYLARLWVGVEVPFLKRLSPLRARVSMAFRPSLIIDLLAILPFFLGQLFSIDLRVLRILRLLRFLKLSRYSPAMHTLLRVHESDVAVGIARTACQFGLVGVAYGRWTGLTAFCSYYDNAVRCACTIECCGGSILQNVDTLDVLRVDALDGIAYIINVVGVVELVG